MEISKASSKDSNRRYYLHRRIRMNGVTVYAHRRLIEIEGLMIPDLYNIPRYHKLIQYIRELKKNHNYILQTVIMKANNKEELATATEEKEEVKLLIKDSVLAKQFSHLTKNIDKLSKYADSLIIDGDETLTVAENNSGEINTLLKAIDKVRTEYKKPYFETVKAIDAHAKTLSGPLTKAKGDVNEAITNWKTVQEAASRAAAEKIRKDAEELADAKAAEVDRIHRIESQLIARLYGGHWFNANKERKTSAGCVTTQLCDDLLTIVKEKIPSAEDFVYLQDEYKKMKKDFLKKLSQHKSSVIELESESSTIKKNAEKKIDEAKTTAGIEVNEKKDEITQEIVKEATKEIKSAEADTKEAGKGVRKTLHFEIAEVEDVPLDWLLLDDKKVREYVSENKEAIKAMLKEGKNVKNGIKFWLGETFVSR